MHFNTRQVCSRIITLVATKKTEAVYLLDPIADERQPERKFDSSFGKACCLAENHQVVRPDATPAQQFQDGSPTRPANMKVRVAGKKRLCQYVNCMRPIPYRYWLSCRLKAPTERSSTRVRHCCFRKGFDHGCQ